MASTAAFAGAKKLIKAKDVKPTDLEIKVANEMFALENASSKDAPNNSFKTDLKGLSFTKAVEVELEGGKKSACVIFVPPPMLTEFRKTQKALLEELEKKLGSSTTQCLLVANRTMVPPGLWQRSKLLSGVRPRSRTLRNVQDNLLDDLLFPVEIVGKRTKIKVDGSRLLKVLLSKKDADAVEGKTDGYRQVFKKFTNRDITFEFV
jgi:small subunit ribosomal protein S7e